MIDKEISGVKEMLKLESKIRDETQVKIHKMINDNTVRLQSEVQVYMIYMLIC